MSFTPEFTKLLQDTSMKHAQDLKLTEVPQRVYEEAYEFLMKKYGTAMGRTNLMLNGHLITPALDGAFKAHEKVVAEERTAKLVEQKPSGRLGYSDENETGPDSV